MGEDGDIISFAKGPSNLNRSWIQALIFNFEGW
jgi:hypothetical protein